MLDRPDWKSLTPPQRLEILEPHRVEGASASEMAMLFTNASRNAVIGVLHRAKLPLLASLNGRPSMGKSALRIQHTVADVRERQRQSTARVNAHGNKGQPMADAIRHRAEARKNANGGLSFKIAQARKDGLSGPEAMEAVLGRPAVPLEEIEVGVDVTHLVGLMQLTSDTCRWPIGDPRQPGFGFCGAPPVEGKTYCKHHEGRAYHRI